MSEQNLAAVRRHVDEVYLPVEAEGRSRNANGGRDRPQLNRLYADFALLDNGIG
jgi:hypothetical protein